LLGETPWYQNFQVKFRGEEAEDAGGVTKEFFLLLLRDILDPKYGMFKIYEESQTIWFHSCCFEENLNFFLIGVLCGLVPILISFGR
jgi:E3 ubiquitin-protein ligase HERC4